MIRSWFTVKKAVLLLILFLLLGGLYYQLIWKSTQQTMKKYSIEEIEQEVLVAQTKLKTMKTMQETIQEQKKNGIIVDYNNLQNEILELNRILSNTISYQMDFEDPTTDQSIIRRNIHVSFEAKNYKTAKKVLQSLQQCKYKSLIKNMMISSSSSDLSNGEMVTVSLEITFFEGISEASLEAGLNQYMEEPNSNGG